MTLPLLIAIIGGGVVAAAIGLNYLPGQEEASEKIPVVETAKRTVAGETAKRAVAEAAAKAVKTAELAAKTTEKPLAPTPSPLSKDPTPPTFGVVRVNPRGDTVIAGHAQPGGTVAILDEGKTIGEAIADVRGEWVFVPDKPLPPGNRQLSLEMRLKGKGRQPLPSESIVVLAVPKGAPRPLALKVPRTGEGASTVMQKPTVEPKSLVSGVPYKFIVNVVDYDVFGALSIAGGSAPEALIQLYLDNAFIGRTLANNGGLWNLTPTRQVAAGLYTLRADHVDMAGKVLARVEFPFFRAEPLKNMAPGTFVVVQPGNNLWRLARRTYGSGFRYSVIYEANKNQIKNADLIYPGQVFTLPATN